MMQTKVQKNNVVIRMDKGDYRLIRLVLENAKQTSPDANIRMGIADLILPHMPTITS